MRSSPRHNRRPYTCFSRPPDPGCAVPRRRSAAAGSRRSAGEHRASVTAVSLQSSTRPCPAVRGFRASRLRRACPAWRHRPKRIASGSTPAKAPIASRTRRTRENLRTGRPRPRSSAPLPGTTIAHAIGGHRSAMLHAGSSAAARVSGGAGRVGIGLRRQRRDGVGERTARWKFHSVRGQHPPARDQRLPSATRCVSVPRAHSTCAGRRPAAGCARAQQRGGARAALHAPQSARSSIHNASNRVATGGRRSAPAQRTGTPPDAPAARSPAGWPAQSGWARRPPPPPARRRARLRAPASPGAGRQTPCTARPDVPDRPRAEGFSSCPKHMPSSTAFSTRLFRGSPAHGIAHQNQRRLRLQPEPPRPVEGQPPDVLDQALAEHAHRARPAAPGPAPPGERRAGRGPTAPSRTPTRAMGTRARARHPRPGR